MIITIEKSRKNSTVVPVIYKLPYSIKNGEIEFDVSNSKYKQFEFCFKPDAFYFINRVFVPSAHSFNDLIFNISRIIKLSSFI